jgi:hypothetical protein
VFCSVSCWEVHLPDANHREAWAVERRAPATLDAEPARGAASAPPPASRATATATAPAASGGQRRLVRPVPPAASAPAAPPAEVLIVASRLKDYVRAKAGYNTSDRVLEPLSEIVRRIADQAIENARRDGRMTVLERDIPEL